MVERRESANAPSTAGQPSSLSFLIPPPLPSALRGWEGKQDKDQTNRPEDEEAETKSSRVAGHTSFRVPEAKGHPFQPRFQRVVRMFRLLVLIVVLQICVLLLESVSS